MDFGKGARDLSKNLAEFDLLAYISNCIWATWGLPNQPDLDRAQPQPDLVSSTIMVSAACLWSYYNLKYCWSCHAGPIALSDLRLSTTFPSAHACLSGLGMYMQTTWLMLGSYIHHIVSTINFIYSISARFVLAYAL